jgi:steroid delta-isomerase-like uncharacterized protein
VESPKKYIDALYAAVRNRDLERVLDMFTEDCVFIDIASPGNPIAGRDGLRALMEETWLGLPDYRPENERLICEGHRVAVELELVGTHRGEYLGHQPTNKEIRWPACATYELTDGNERATREVYYYDSASLISQLASPA